MKFPIYKDDRRAFFQMSQRQREAFNQVIGKIESGQYVRVRNRCFCNCEEGDKGLLVSEKDSHGFPLRSILCTKTGLVCSEQVFDQASNNSFYANEYRDLVAFYGKVEDFFEVQQQRGRQFQDLLSEHISNDCHALNIAEIGCGAGGVLFPFLQAKHKCVGFDYNQDYLDFGKSRGLDLRLGDYQDHLQDGSCDLIILSHVMEHFLDPIHEIQDVIEKIKHGAYLFVEVPGIYFKKGSMHAPLQYLQIAHVVNFFTYDFLRFFFEALNLKVVYGDDRCTFICQKPEGWNPIESFVIPEDMFKSNAEEVKAYIVSNHKRYNRHWKTIAIAILDFLRIRKFVKGSCRQ